MPKTGTIEEGLYDVRRREKLQLLHEAGITPYPSSRPVPHCAADCLAAGRDLSAEELDSRGLRFTIAGRVRAKNEMGRAGFAKLQDRSGQLQIYLRKNLVGPEAFALWKKLDLGDWVRASGELMLTRRGDLTLKVSQLDLLSKCMRSLPDKWRGVSDVEFRYRHRYVDLLMDPDVQRIFRTRAAVLRRLRRFFEARDFLEVETPMMHVIPGGAAARPFVTHHNALDIDLYLRVAPELFLKRLVVGGFERVFEVNRNFRNEGLSQKHNPEFTMLEFYQAHATYEDLMQLTEELVCELVRGVDQGMVLPWGDERIRFAAPRRRATMGELISEHTGLSETDREDPQALRARWIADFGNQDGSVEKTLPETMGSWWEWFFDAYVEDKLRDPVFVTRFPVEISPLSRRCDDDPRFVDRFELIIAGQEIANGFNELNDPADQAARFQAQAAKRQAGEDEAMYYDADYVEALCYGMPPAAGEGIGIDRLVMLLTDQQSIREVILFPTMRPKGLRAGDPEEEAPDKAPS